MTWSEPIWIGQASHSGRPDRDGRTIGSLVSTPGAQFLQYRTYDSAGNFAPLPGFEIDYIDATAGPSLEQVANPALTPVFSPPPLITRAGWGADESLRFGNGGEEIFPVEYQPVEHVIIHHADTANFNDPVLEMRSIYYFHAITRGWGDIAYNYLVDFMGNVYEGRVGGEGAVGCHAEGYNAGSCGICLMGRFFEDATTPEMHNAIVWISSWAARNLDPTSAAPFHDIASLPTICGHRDVNNTSCPGDEFYVQLDTVRTEARRVIRGRDDPEPPPPEWYPGMRVLTNAEGVSLRSGPGTDFDVAAKVAIGEPLLVLQGPATNDSTIWYEVQGVSLTGWIAGNLLTRTRIRSRSIRCRRKHRLPRRPRTRARHCPKGSPRRLRSRSQRRTLSRLPSRAVRPAMSRMAAETETRNNFRRRGRSSPPARRRASPPDHSTSTSSRRSGQRS